MKDYNNLQYDIVFDQLKIDCSFSADILKPFKNCGDLE
jgi:hypothetical protein